MQKDERATHLHDDVLNAIDAMHIEWSEVRARRKAQRITDQVEGDEILDQGKGQPDFAPPHAPRNAVGLALSGGGIRSATFNLGVLQALNALGLLRLFDYVSTVSGGGFVGGWWSAWLARTENAFTAGVPRPLFPSDEELEFRRYRQKVDDKAKVAPDPIHHIRLFANYLTPRIGLFSPDVWRAIVIVSRNMGLTWLILLPLLFVAVLLAQAGLLSLASSDVADAFYSANPVGWAVLGPRVLAALVPAVAVFGWFIVLCIVWLMLHRGNSQVQQGFALAALVVAIALVWRITGIQMSGALLAWAGGALALAVASLWEWPLERARHPSAFVYERLRSRVTGIQGALLASSVVLAAVFVAAALGHEAVKYAVSMGDSWQKQLVGWTGRLSSLIATIGAIHTWFAGAPRGGSESREPGNRAMLSRVLLSIAPALVMITLLALTAFAVNALMLHLTTLEETNVAAIFWNTTIVGVALTIGLAASESKRAFRSWRWAPVAVSLIATGVGRRADSAGWSWAAMALSLACAAGFAVLIFWKDNKHASRSDYLLLGGSIATVGMGALALLPVHPNVQVLLGASAFLATVMLGLGWSVDPNNLSLHMFYKARLVRAYLGASNPRRARDNDDVTTSLEGDNLALRALAPCSNGVPYHLVNTTLNLAAGDDVTIAQRRAANFTLSRLHCGSARTGYRPTDGYMGGDLSLGTAVAVSGAAASPNMGSQTPSTALAMLMALLNVRLGFWAPTPHQSDWQAPQARLWPFYLMREFFSRTTDQRAFCYLTDGGHFDNTALYSLIERGCRYIVVADCGADPDGVFDDLSNAVRRCRIDFRTEITLPGIDSLSRKTEAVQRRAFIVGTIKYTQAHLTALGWSPKQIKDDALDEGVIVVLKPNLLAEPDLDTRRYGQQCTDFPQETTGDQWYDEAQFESYRRLGQRSVRAVLDTQPAAVQPVAKDGTINTNEIATLFKELSKGIPKAPAVVT